MGLRWMRLAGAVLMGLAATVASAQFRPIGAGQGSYQSTEAPPTFEPKSIQFDPNELPSDDPSKSYEQPQEPPSRVSDEARPPARAADQTSTQTLTAQPHEEDLWDRIRLGYRLQEATPSLVRRHERYFASQPEYVGRIFDRSRRYLYHILEEVERRGMPSEIALLPMVESAFNPHAYSRAHASGIWQFIPSTGRHFGLKQNWWHDDRRDVHAATEAALDYLQSLYVRFGDWQLALAAYNGGEGRVQRAIQFNRARGLPTTYGELPLPWETRNYVPKLLAIRNVIDRPQAFGLTIASIPNTPYFTAVNTNKPIDLKRAAEFAEIPVDEFLALNPAFNRPVITSSGQRTILVPAETADIFLAKLENPDQPLVSWRMHKLKRGESIDKAADQFGISSQELRQVNGIPSSRKLAGGGAILVPHENTDAALQPVLESDSAPESTVAGPVLPRATRTLTFAAHRVRKGDTLFGIARRYGVSADDLRTWNRMRSNAVRVGQALVIHRATVPARAAAEPKAPAAAQITKTGAPAKHDYVAKRGDTLYSIARRFDVSVGELQRENKLSRARPLLAGMRVAIPVSRRS